MSEVAAVPADRDKAVIGVSSAGQATLDRLIEIGWFRTEAAAFQAAASLALAAGLEPIEGSYGTKWGRGGAFSSMLAFLEWYVPTPTPARYIEGLAEAGLALIQGRLRPGARLTDVFELQEADAI